MGLKGAFQKKLANSGVERLQAAILKDDVLGVATALGNGGWTGLLKIIDRTLAKSLSPQMAAVISGPNGVAREEGKVLETGTVAQPDLFLHLLGALLETGNTRALDVVIRKEKDSFNGWSGTDAMVRIIEAPITVDNKLRYLSTVLEAGHDRMTFPEHAVLKAASRNMHRVVDMLAEKGLFAKHMPFKLQQPEPDRR